MKDVLTDIVQGLNVAFTQQLKDVQNGILKPEECSLIPKNLKEVQVLFTMIQSLQPKEVPVESKSSASVTTVNVQNLIAGNNTATTASSQSSALKELAATSPSMIPYEDDDNELDESDDEFDLLLRAKGGIPQ
jgi:hypothetical protein